MPGPTLRRTLLTCATLTLALATAGCGSSPGNATPRGAVSAYNIAAAKHDYTGVCKLLQKVAWSALTGGSSKVTCPQALATADGRYQLSFYRLTASQIQHAELTIYDGGKLAILRSGGANPHAYALRHTAAGWLIDSP